MCFFVLIAHTPLGTKAAGLWWQLRSLLSAVGGATRHGRPRGWALNLVAQFPRLFTHLLRFTRRSRWQAALLPLIPRWVLVADGFWWAHVLTCSVWSTSAAWLRWSHTNTDPSSKFRQEGRDVEGCIELGSEGRSWVAWRGRAVEEEGAMRSEFGGITLSLLHQILEHIQ